MIDFLIGIGSHGGVETVLNRVLPYIAGRGEKVRVIQMVYADEDWVAPGIEFHCILSGPDDATYEKMVSGYEQLLLSSSGFPSMIVATGWPLLTTLGRQVILDLKLDSCKLAAWPHSDMENYMEKDLGGYEQLKYADIFLCINNTLYQKFCQHFPGKKVVLTYNPVDFRKIIYSDDRNSKELCFVGRPDNIKNIPVILSGLAMMPEQWQLKMIGCSDVPPLSEWIDKLNIRSRVELIEWCENPWKELEHTAALVMASLHEGFPLVVLEALACGMFVISTPVNGVIDIIEPGKNGFLFSQNSAEELSAIVRWLDDGTLQRPGPIDCKNSISEFEDNKPLSTIYSALELV